MHSSLRQHCDTSRDWQWLGEIPCQIYIPESRSWSFPFVCKITRTGRSLPKFPSPQHFGRILQAEGEISATQLYIREKGGCLLDKFPKVGKNSMTYYEDIGSNLEGCVFTVGSVRRLAYGKPLDCSTGNYVPRQRPSIGVRRPSIDVQISQWVDYQSFLSQFTLE